MSDSSTDNTDHWTDQMLRWMLLPLTATGIVLEHVGEIAGLLGLPLVAVGVLLQVPHDILSGNVNVNRRFSDVVTEQEEDNE